MRGRVPALASRVSHILHLPTKITTALVLLIATQRARPISAFGQGLLDVKLFPERAVSLSCREAGRRWEYGHTPHPHRTIITLGCLPGSGNVM